MTTLSALAQLTSGSLADPFTQYRMPAGHYYRLVTSGTGTFAITSVNETIN